VNIKIYEDKNLLGRAAAEHAALAIRNAIRDRGKARIIAATGASQFEFLEALTVAPGVDWRRVELFHLDEYIGLPVSHPASFRKYLFDRLIQKTGIATYHLLDGSTDPEASARSVGQELNSAPVDIAFVGIGENGHLAFNDPPADFQTETPFLIVELDEACRRQQVGEGWFADVSEVPRRAITMSIRQILKAREIIASVPDARKARAVKACCEGAIIPSAPASALRMHPKTTVFLDLQSAALLNPEVRAQV
jgi:glucosamine-6-phosphate deaminase